MAGFNAMTEIYEEITLLEKPALFTGARLDRSTVPEGLYAYDVRHDDECQGIPCEVANYIMVNHWGTVLTVEPLDLGEQGYRLLEEEDWDYVSIPGQTRGIVGSIAYYGPNRMLQEQKNYEDKEMFQRSAMWCSENGKEARVQIYLRPVEWDDRVVYEEPEGWVRALSPSVCHCVYERVDDERPDCHTTDEFARTYRPTYWQDLLYNRLAKEQQTYREWLLAQPADELLNCSYRYWVQEDILLAAEDCELLSKAEAKALCQTKSPMGEIYKAYLKRESGHMEEITDCISCRGQELEQQKRKGKER